MTQIVRNAQALGAAVDRRGIPMLGAHKGYTTTHQVIADMRQFVGRLHRWRSSLRRPISSPKRILSLRPRPIEGAFG